MNLRLAALALAGALSLAGHPAAAFGVANPYASGTSAGSIHIDTLLAFGDSYTAAGRKAFPNWVEQMKAAGEIASLADFAKSGATAGNYSGYTNTWAMQIKKWRATSPTFGPRDLTVVYLGYNDIDGGTAMDGADLVPAENAYKANLNTILNSAGGAAKNGRRVFLVMVHNWGRSPYYVRNGGAQTMRKRTVVWNNFVAQTAKSTPGAIAVDMYDALEYVFNNPAKFGFNNITVADHTRSTTTAFFDDDFHPGKHAQALIEQVIEYYLTLGWDKADTRKAPADVKADMQAALDAGEVFGSGQTAAVASAQTRTAPAAAPPTKEPTLAQLEADPEHFGVAWARMMLKRGDR
jgi:phospholipase/lecithinase/hemolysin